MNLYLEPPGFLGTGASLLADITLLLYILVIVPSILVGWVFARRNMHRPQHRNVMIGITILNWVLIVTLMIVAYRFDVADNITTQPTTLRYLLPTLHAVLGLPAQLLATYVVIRMVIEDTQVAQAKRRGETGKTLSRYWFKQAKPIMRLTLGLWLATAALGIVTYVIRYNVLPSGAAGDAVAPIATEEVLTPVETLEITAPVTTPEITPPLETPEVR